MTLSEALLFLEGVNNRKREQLYNTRWIMWSTLQSQSSKKIKVEDVLRIEGEKIQAPRAGISKEEHKALVEKFNRIKSKENDRTSSKREGVRIEPRTIREPR